MIVTILVLGIIALLILIYPFVGAFLVAMGVGNESRFTSEAFQLQRINKLFPPTSPPHLSLKSVNSALLPVSASDASWEFTSGDDSWLVTVATLTWNESGTGHKAQWVIRYCLDWKWTDHFIEAASLNYEAQKLTPSFKSRGAIYGDGTGIPMKPIDKSKCLFY